MKRNLISCLTKSGIGTSGPVCIDRFGIVMQEDTKQNETEAYPNKNLADFKKNWNRTARGNRPNVAGRISSRPTSGSTNDCAIGKLRLRRPRRRVRLG